MTNERSIKAFPTSFAATDQEPVLIRLGMVCATLTTSEALQLADQLLKAAEAAEAARLPKSLELFKDVSHYPNADIL